MYGVVQIYMILTVAKPDQDKLMMQRTEKKNQD